MQLISEIEGRRRGRLRRARSATSATTARSTPASALRTIVMRDGLALLQAGAGIVADSVPAIEHQRVPQQDRSARRGDRGRRDGPVRAMSGRCRAVRRRAATGRARAQLLLVDNYDSFTYNLAHLFCEAGADVDVRRHDAVSEEEAEALAPTHLVISPGPGRPNEAGVSGALIRRFAGRIPVLGVCLGHQCLVEAYGGRVDRATRLMHGKVGSVRQIAADPLLDDLPEPFEAGRYHSLAALPPVPDELEVTAFDADGEIMAVRHRELAHLHGLQFHPESILTPDGDRIARRFLALAERAMIPSLLPRLLRGESLTEEEAQAVIGHVMDGDASEAQIAGLLVALRAKGESVAEIVGAARAMRTHAIAVAPRRTRPRRHLRHGRRRPADVQRLHDRRPRRGRRRSRRREARQPRRQLGLGLGGRAGGARRPARPPAERVAECIDEVGFGFLFAPAHHPAMRHAGPVRRSLGVRTIFNVLGPLTNPVGARRQLVGVFDEALVVPIAETLRALGSERALVVHGHDGLDELSPAGPSICADVTPGRRDRRHGRSRRAGTRAVAHRGARGRRRRDQRAAPARAARRRARPAPRRRRR